MTYRILVSDRKIVVKKIEDLTGEKPAYTRMPRCAFVLRGIVVEKNGTVTADETADDNLLKHLIAAGMIEVIQEEPLIAPNTGSSEEASADGSTMAECETVEAIITAAPEPIQPTISVPLKGHTAESIRNLICTIYSKGCLMSRATRGHFEVKRDFVEELLDQKLIRLEDALAAVREAPEGSVIGVTLEEDRITFDGFPETDDPDTLKAWMALTAAINRSVIQQNRVRAKETDETNEKFAFRVWITRLGMAGSEFKQERNILYKHLSGHTAFRTAADQEKWTQRQKEKRDQFNALRDAAREESESRAED